MRVSSVALAHHPIVYAQLWRALLKAVTGDQVFIITARRKDVLPVNHKLNIIYVFMTLHALPLYGDGMNDLNLFSKRGPWTHGSVLMSTKVELFAPAQELDQGLNNEQIMKDVTKGVLITARTANSEFIGQAPSTNYSVEFLAVMDPVLQRHEVAELDMYEYENLVHTGILTGKCFALYIPKETNWTIHTCYMNDRYEEIEFSGKMATPAFLRFTRNGGILGPTIWSQIVEGKLSVTATNLDTGERVVTVSGQINQDMDMRLVLTLVPDRNYLPVRIEKWIWDSYTITDYSQFIKTGDDIWFPTITKETIGFMVAGKMQNIQQTEHRIINGHVTIEDMRALELLDLKQPESIAVRLLAPGR